jgi:hypothetical protein
VDDAALDLRPTVTGDAAATVPLRVFSGDSTVAAPNLGRPLLHHVDGRGRFARFPEAAS